MPLPSDPLRFAPRRAWNGLAPDERQEILAKASANPAGVESLAARYAVEPDAIFSALPDFAVDQFARGDRLPTAPTEESAADRAVRSAQPGDYQLFSNGNLLERDYERDTLDQLEQMLRGPEDQPPPGPSDWDISELE